MPLCPGPKEERSEAFHMPWFPSFFFSCLEKNAQRFRAFTSTLIKVISAIQWQPYCIVGRFMRRKSNSVANGSEEKEDKRCTRLYCNDKLESVGWVGARCVIWHYAGVCECVSFCLIFKSFVNHLLHIWLFVL